MGSFVKIAKISDISDGEMKEVHAQGKVYTVAKIGNEVLVFDGYCTHAQCSLAGGFLDGNTLTCYCHGAMFDIKTGDVLSPPATEPLNTYTAKLEGEDILIEI